MSAITEWFSSHWGEVVAIGGTLVSTLLTYVGYRVRLFLKMQRAKAETQLSLLETISDNSVTKPIWNTLREEMAGVETALLAKTTEQDAHLEEVRRELYSGIAQIGNMLADVFKDVNISAEAKDKLREAQMKLFTHTDEEVIASLNKELTSRNEYIAKLEAEIAEKPVILEPEQVKTVKTEKRKVRS